MNINRISKSHTAPLAHPAGSSCWRSHLLLLLVGELPIEIGVAEGIGCGYPLLRVGKKHPLEEGHGQDVHSFIEFPLEGEFHFFVLAVDFLVLSALEQRPPGEEDVEDSPEREDIAVGLNVLVLGEGDDFRGDVAWSAAPEEEIVVEVGMGGESIVDDDRGHRPTAPQQYVLRLQVAVHQSLPVHGLHPTQHSPHHLLDLLLRKTSLPLLYPVQQLSSPHHFLHHVDGVLGLVHSL